MLGMRTQITLPSLGAILILLACSSEGGGTRKGAPAANLALSPESAQALSEEPTIAEELGAVLTEYFGQPLAPRFALLEEWKELGFDPNGSPLEGARPASDVVGTPASAILADNQRAWARELTAIETGDASGLGPWRRRSTMNVAWQELESQRGKLSASEFKQRATAFFAERYPDLDEAAQMFVPNCARCHGREGGGDGPMSGRLYPKPRNYHPGVFKFAAVEGGSKPRRIDLVRTLVQGLPGSAMPSFRGMSLAELSALVDYVRYLSIRGQVERLVLAEWENDDVRPRESIAEMYALVWERWLEAAENAQTVVAPVPDPDPARLVLGDAVFHDAKRGNCMSCHGDDGRGNGPSAVRFGEDGRMYSLLRDDWGDYILPRDLTSGIFRGGNRREDLYMRIHCGIHGTPMPSIGQSKDAEGAPLLSEEEKWAVVDYVLSLSGQGPLAAR